MQITWILKMLFAKCLDLDVKTFRLIYEQFSWGYLYYRLCRIMTMLYITIRHWCARGVQSPKCANKAVESALGSEIIAFIGSWHFFKRCAIIIWTVVYMPTSYSTSALRPSCTLGIIPFQCRNEFINPNYDCRFNFLICKNNNSCLI